MQLLKPSMAEKSGPIAESETMPEPLEDVKQLAPIECRFASLSSRFFACLIDMTLLGFIMVLTFLIPSFSEMRLLLGAKFTFLFVVTYLIILFLYYTSLEGVKGVTIGKWLLGIKVVNQDLHNISMGDSVTRNALRIVDAFPFFVPYLLGVIVMWRGEHRQRVGDLAARTVVINI